MFLNNEAASCEKLCASSVWNATRRVQALACGTGNVLILIFVQFSVLFKVGKVTVKGFLEKILCC